MENLNLIEILKNVPEGTKLYSPIFGECELNGVSNDFIYVSGKHGGYLNKDGTYYEGCGECQLFPSKENRDWSTFKIEKEDFQVGDYVKVKSLGNYFQTKEEAEKYTEKFLEIFKKIKSK